MKDETPIWIPCPDCDEFFCTIHNEHAHECSCPSVDEFSERGIDPYLDTEDALKIES